MAKLQLIYRTNDMIVELDALRNAATGAYVNTATVEAEITDPEGNILATGISMTYIASTNGKYQGTIQDTLAFVVNTFYTVTITAALAGVVGTWEIPAQCVRRQE